MREYAYSLKRAVLIFFFFFVMSETWTGTQPNNAAQITPVVPIQYMQ